MSGAFAHLVIRVVVYHRYHHIGNYRVELRALAAYYLRADGRLLAHRGVRTVRCHSIIAVRYTYYARLFRDIHTRKPVRVAVSVVAFVVPARTCGKSGYLGDDFQYAVSYLGMLLYLRILAVVKAGGLVDYRLAHAYLADIVQKSHVIYLVLLLLCLAHAPCYLGGVGGNSLRVTVGVVIFCIDCLRKREHDLF